MQEDDYLAKLQKSLGYPSEIRFDKGAVAVIECIQDIPCNPCETSCRFKAIIVRIIRVFNPPKNNKTAVVTVAVKKEFSNTVRNIILRRINYG